MAMVTATVIIRYHHNASGWKGGEMSKQILNKTYFEYFEYHGSTAIEWIKKRGKRIVGREWLLFDSVEEAREFFSDYCHV